MHRTNFIAAACLLVLAACGQQASAPASDDQETEAGAPAGACTAQASIDWAPTAGRTYTIAASAAGPACDAGVATLTVRDGVGNLLYTGAHQIEPMTSTVFAEADTPAKLEAALAGWIDPNGSNLRSTGALPDWPRGAEGPMSAEFPFYPEEGTTRDAWLRLRAQDKPLFCFVQGGESLLCLALDVGAETLTPIGVQTFPG